MNEIFIATYLLSILDFNSILILISIGFFIIMYEFYRKT